jgi:hypothetical protein
LVVFGIRSIIRPRLFFRRLKQRSIGMHGNGELALGAGIHIARECIQILSMKVVWAISGGQTLTRCGLSLRQRDALVATSG